MARLPRLSLPGYAHHVIQRGNNRQAIFSSPSDRQVLLALIGESARQCGVALHAYVLMDNHFHLLATPESADALPRMMQAVGRRYVRYFNDGQGRTGTLWEGRYRSTLIQPETYLLACMAYMDLNPVRAGLCPDPAHYRWRSYRANALGETSPGLTPHPLYATLGPDEASRLAAYRERFAHVLADKTITDIRLALKQTQPLGNSRFFDAIEQATGQRREAKPRGRPRKPEQDASPQGNAKQLRLAGLDQ